MVAGSVFTTASAAAAADGDYLYVCHCSVLLLPSITHPPPPTFLALTFKVIEIGL